MKLLWWAFGAVIAGNSVAAEELGQVTVAATRPTKVVVGRSSSTGAPVEEVTLSRKVNYSDLNLATNQGAAELEKRVKDEARAACKELDRFYPLETFKEITCAKKAADDAMPQVQAAISAAEKQSPTAK